MTVLRNKIALALSEPFTADESRKAGKDRSGSQYVLADRVLALLVDDSADRAGVLFAELTAVREELKAVKGNRLVSAVFAMPQGQPHPKVFALYRAGDGQVAMGVQFPDGAIMVRWTGDAEFPLTTINEHPKESVEGMLGDDRTTVVWLSEELESLAQQEKRAEEAEAQLQAVREKLLEAEKYAEHARICAAILGIGIDPEGFYAGTPGDRLRELLAKESELGSRRRADLQVSGLAAAYDSLRVQMCTNCHDQVCSEHPPSGGILAAATGGVTHKLLEVRECSLVAGEVHDGHAWGSGDSWCPGWRQPVSYDEEPPF